MAGQHPEIRRAETDVYLVLDDAGLRRFGLLLAAFLVLTLGLALPWLWGFALPWWPWALAGALAACAWLAPARLGPVYRYWMKFAAVLGWVNTRLLLALAFYLVLTPTALVLRALGRNPLARGFDPGAPSYRKRCRPRPADHLEKPF